MMGGKSSKNKDGDAPRPSPPPPLPPALPTFPNNSPYTDDLNSYEAACRLDPDLQSFDATVHERTARFVNTLASGVEVRSLSFDSLREVTSCLLEMNQEVVKVILECKKDIWNNQELFALVEEYFDNSIMNLDFCTSLENCLKRSRNSQLIIQWAVRRFEEEAKGGNDVGGMKYTNTLEELRKFKAAGDPFTEEFFMLFKSVYKQQKSMLQKLELRKKRLDKKLKSLKTWRRVSNVLFVAAFVSVLIFSVVAAAIAAPPVVTALAAALAVPVGSVGKWCSVLWKRCENELKGQREMVSSMWTGTFITIQDMDNVRLLVNKLEIVVESLMQKTDFAQRDDEAVTLAIEEIKKKLEEFTQSIDVLIKHADKCSRDIRMARTVILQRIIRDPNS
ncbi:DUF677 domain-containing protein [Cephalotus follicularis]|uniref:DUF677 domain-containing protein n=1 Tax=Cephalotus follicularis TaxID=3775 RepID=A0A1Q3C9J2_CEPFO|nr:DUF677 domain-containing protein [Cephalotus follicularis]